MHSNVPRDGHEPSRLARARHRYLLPLIPLIVGALGAAACSAAAPASGEATGSTASADTTGSGGVANSCDPALLSWNLAAPGSKQTCSGGVSYAMFKTSCEVDVTPAQDPTDCPTTTTHHSHTNTNSCWYADGWSGSQHVHALIPTHVVRECCDVSISGWCPKPPCYNTTVPSETCAQMAQATVNSYHSGYNGQLWGQPFAYGQYVSYANPVTSNGYCDYDLSSLPQNWGYKSNALNCGVTTVTDPDTYTYPSCTKGSQSDPSCTCATYPDNHKCGDDGKAYYLPPGDSYGDVPATQSPDLDKSNSFCETDENNAISAGTLQTDVRGKYSRLLANLKSANAGGMPGIDDAAVARDVVREIKLLFEFYGDQLDAGSRQDVVNLYVATPDVPSTPGCGVAFVAPDTSQCSAAPATIATLNGQMEFCARMTSGHVSAPVRNLDVVQKTCVTQAAANIGALRGSLLAHGYDDGTASVSTAGGGTDAGTAPDAAADAGAASDAAGDAAPSADAGAQDPNDPCGFKLYRAQYDTFVTNSVAGRMESYVDPRVTSNDAEITARLQLMDSWYKAISSNLWPYNAGSEPYATQVRGVAWQHATDMERTFWEYVYRNLFPAGAVTAADGGAIALGPDGSLPDAGGAHTTTFDANALAALVLDTLNADRQVLSILFPYNAGASTQPAVPIQSAPLLLILGDVFEAMSQRMHDVGVYHDMGCAYLGCGPAVQSELVWLIELLGSIPDSTPTTAANPDPMSFATVLGNAHIARDRSGNTVVRPEWLGLYDAMAAQHGAIESAYQSALGAGSSYSYVTDGMPNLLEGAIPQLPKPAQHFSSVVQLARSAAQTYAKTGLFNPTARNRLPLGVSQDNIDAIRNVVAQAGTNLATATDRFDSNLTQIANSVIQEMTAQTAMTNSWDILGQKAAAYDNTLSDLDGQRESLRENTAQFGAYAQTYPTATAFDANALVQGSSYGPWMFDTFSAKATGPIASNAKLPSVAAQTVPGIPAGSIVTVQVGANNKWSPTCALHKKKTLPTSQSATNVPISADGAVCGPEGFTGTLTASGYSATGLQGALTVSNTTTASVEAKTCAGVKAEVGPDFFGQASVKAYVDTSVCASIGNTTSVGATGSATISSGNDTRGSMTFAAGMRLDNAPITSAPVGSLLAIVTPKGNPAVWTSMSVVQAPATGLIVDQDSDLYLLSNDIAAPVGDPDCKPDTQDQLQVSVTTAQHAGSELAWVTPALASVATFLDGLSSGDPNSSTPSAPAGSLIAQGHLTPDQSQEIRSTAMLKLVSACNAINGVDAGAGGGGGGSQGVPVCDTSKLPPTVMEFITNLIDRAIEQIELKLEIVQSIRTANGIALELQQMVDDYNAANSQIQVAALIPQWTLRNLDTTMLQAQTAQLVNVTTYDLYPVLQLRFPELFDPNNADGILQDQVLANQFQLLRDAQWDAPIDTLARAAATAAQELSTKTANLGPFYPQLKTKSVAVDFVSPKWKAPVPPSAPWQPSYWAVGDATTAWNEATTGNHVATFHIAPENLYHKDNVLPGLLCTEEAPVILDFAVFLSGAKMSTKTVSLFSGALMAGSFSSTNLVFPMGPTVDAQGNQIDPGGPLDFVLSNPTWATLSTPIYANTDESSALFGNASASGTNVYNPAKNSNGKGLSLFSDFTIDFSGLYDPKQFVQPDNNPFTYADHITLVFSVQYRENAGNQALSWIGTCQ